MLQCPTLSYQQRRRALATGVKPYIAHMHIQYELPKLVNGLFSSNFDSESLQCLIDGIRNGSPGSEGSGWNFTLPSLLVALLFRSAWTVKRRCESRRWETARPSLFCNLLRDIFFNKLHHVHGEHIQLERFSQLEMWSRIDRIDEILDEQSYLSVFDKTELYHEDSAIELIQ